jgi:hypothetical protein
LRQNVTFKSEILYMNFGDQSHSFTSEDRFTFTTQDSIWVGRAGLNVTVHAPGCGAHAASHPRQISTVSYSTHSRGIGVLDVLVEERALGRCGEELLIHILLDAAVAIDAPRHELDFQLSR